MLVQFGAFALVGALGTAVHYAVLLGAVQGLGWRPVAATSVGALCGAAINYLLNYHLTFRSRKAHAPTAAKFMLVAGVGLVLNAAIVAALTQGLNAHYMLAQVAATGGVLVWGFLANRLWTFGASR